MLAESAEQHNQSKDVRLPTCSHRWLAQFSFQTRSLPESAESLPVEGCQIARFGRAVHHLQQSQMARPVQQSKSAAIWSQMDCEAQLLEARARRVN